MISKLVVDEQWTGQKWLPRIYRQLGIADMNPILATFLVPVIGGITFIAYNHPKYFRGRAKSVAKVLDKVFFGWWIFVFCGRVYVLCGANDATKEAALKVNTAAMDALSPVGAWVMLPIACLFLLGWVLLTFVCPIKEEANQPDQR